MTLEHQHTVLAGRRRALLTVPLISVLLLGSTACGSDGSKDDDPKQQSSSTPSKKADPQDAEKKAAREAYQKSWEEQTKAYAKASSKGTKLQKYTSLGALTHVESELLSLKDAGQVVTGQPKVSPKVTALRPNQKIPEAEITDCTDVSDWTIVDEKSKKKIDLPSGHLKQHVTIAEMEKWGKQWKLTKLSPQKRAC